MGLTIHKVTIWITRPGLTQCAASVPDTWPTTWSATTWQTLHRKFNHRSQVLTQVTEAGDTRIVLYL